MEWISTIALAVAIVAAIYAFIAQRQDVTAGNVTNAINAVPSRAAELETVATTIVQANEQRKRQGKLSNEQAYDIALNYVRGWFPVNVGITNDQIIAAINSAILLASVATAQIEAAKATVADAGSVTADATRGEHVGRMKN